MNNKFLYKISQKYASKWLVLIFDICVVIFSLFVAYVIRYNFKLNFDLFEFIKQIPFVAITAGICFLIVGSHKGVVRHTGIKDVINVVIGVNILATVLLFETYLTRRFYLIMEFYSSWSCLMLSFSIQITAASFEGSGCAISVASASLLTETIAGSNVSSATAYFRTVTNRLTRSQSQPVDSSDIDIGKIRALDGVREFPARVKCATLAWHALSAAMQQHSTPASTE